MLIFIANKLLFKEFTVVQFNFFKREVRCKIVYFGIASSGKTTNLHTIRQETSKKCDLSLTSSEENRILSLDYTPQSGKNIAGMNCTVTLYTVRGEFTRKELIDILHGIDGVVFVVDSSVELLQQNIAALKQLEEYLLEFGIHIEDLPVVIQWNKRDLENALDLKTLEKNINYLNFPSFEAIAYKNEGVVLSLECCCKLVVNSIGKRVDHSGQQKLSSSSNLKPKISTKEEQHEKPLSKKKPIFKKFEKKFVPPKTLEPPESKIKIERPALHKLQQQERPQAQEKTARKKQLLTVDKFWFEKILSEDAGRPGPLERLVARSVFVMKALQYSIGLNFILIANAIDAVVKIVTSYIDGIFQAWKTLHSLKRRLELDKLDNKAQVALLTKKFIKTRLYISRIFRFSGFDWQSQSITQTDDWSQSTFPLEIVIKSRQDLDEMKRDLSFSSSKQMQKFAKNSIKDFLLSFIPNPIEWLSTMKDVFVMTFFMRYSRADIEKMYAEFLLSYQSFLQNIDNEKKVCEWSKYEQRLLERVGTSFKLDNEIENNIEICKTKIQRFIQVLCHANTVVNPRKWTDQSLLEENQKINCNFLFQLELQRRTTKSLLQKIKLGARCRKLHFNM